MEGKMEKLLPFAECEQVTGIKQNTWRFWAKQRRIAVVYLGRRVKIRESDLQKLIEAGSVPALPQRGR
jgi:Helix-turn-helix domain